MYETTLLGYVYSPDPGKTTGEVLRITLPFDSLTSREYGVIFDKLDLISVEVVLCLYQLTFQIQIVRCNQ